MYFQNKISTHKRDKEIKPSGLDLISTSYVNIGNKADLECIDHIVCGYQLGNCALFCTDP